MFGKLNLATRLNDNKLWNLSFRNEYVMGNYVVGENKR